MTTFTTHTNPKGTSMNREQKANRTSALKTALAATLSNLLRAKRGGALSRTRTLLAALSLTALALALTAAPAFADTNTAEIGTVTKVSYASAHITGIVGNDGVGNTVIYTFQYSSDEGSTWNPGPSSFFLPTTGNLKKEVFGNFEKLKGGTKYIARLVATSFTGAPEAVSPQPSGPYPSFTTLTVDPPTILATGDASKVFSLSATATGEVKRPANDDPAFDVNCRFEYVTEAEWEANANSFPAGAPSAPCAENPITKDSVGVEGKQKVGAHLEGLTASTSYHLRLAAENGAPGVVTKEALNTFTTAPTVAKPTVLATDNASEVEYTQAQAEGLVQRPAGEDPALDTECRFEYISDAQFDENVTSIGPEAGFEGAAQAPCADGLITKGTVNGEGKQAVKAPLPGLTPSTEYHLRLSASNQGGSDAKDAAATFTTAGPIPAPTVIATDNATEVNKRTAKVEGQVERPAGADPALDVTCNFEYISDEQFSNNPPGEEFAGAGQVGCGPENPITSSAPDYLAVTADVNAELTGLTPNTKYHLRLAAQNGGGTVTEDAAGTFTTVALKPPKLTVDPVTDVDYLTAHVTGTVDPGNQGVAWTFEYSPAGQEHWSSPPNFTQTVTAANLPAASVSADFPCIPNSGNPGPGCPKLKPGTTYEVRLAGYNLEEPGEVAVFSDAPYLEFTTKGTSAPPLVTLNSVTFTGTTAHFTGSVDANAPAGVLPQEARDAYETDWRIECIPGCSSHPAGTVQAGEGAKAISVNVNLESKTPYEVKLIAENDLGTVKSEQSFETPLIAPSVKSLPGGSDGEGGYILAGVVNPNHSEITSCEFKWGPNAPAYAFSAPCSPLAPGNGGKPVTVEAHLTKLTPGAVYHADLVIESDAFGADDSKDFSFTPTLAVKGPPCPNEGLREENGSLGLPECRAYEQVTYPNKQGWGTKMVDFNGGDALAYGSKAENLVNSGPAAFTNRYVATRTPTGWETIPDLNGPGGSLYSAPEFAESYGPGAQLYSADLLSSIWPLKKEGTEGQYYPYLRRPDGKFVQVGVGATESIAVFSFFAASDDLTHVVFSSTKNLVTPSWGPGVYEFVGTDNDQPRRVDVDNSGTPVGQCGQSSGLPGIGTPDSNANAVSNDGRVIVFTAKGGCGGANPPADEVWARVGGTVSYDVSASLCARPDCNAPAAATFQGAAKDGSRIYFTTTQQLLDGDTDQTNDLYACDIPPGTPAPVGNANPCTSLTEVSGTSGGANVVAGPTDIQNALPSGDVTVSDDGSTVYFTAKGVLADNEDALGEEAVPGDNNLYVWRTDAAHPAGQATFLARLPESDSRVAQTTPDGRYLVLQTRGQLVPTDTDNATDIYRYAADTEEMTRVSTAVSGTGGNADAFDARLGSRPAFEGGGLRTPSKTQHHSHFSISDNGELIVFQTSEALSPLDGNGEPDAYLWNDGHNLGSVAPLLPDLSGGQNEAGQVFIDGSGEDIYAQTAARLTPTDVDTSTDVYDVRAGGGFPQHQEGCTGETCQPGTSTPPAPESPETDKSREGNPAQPKPCPKGKVRRHGKCMKKHTKGQKHKKSHKKTGHNRGGSK